MEDSNGLVEVADAAPYFRIFNPITQADKFDKDGKYRDQFNSGWREENSNDGRS